MISQTLQAPHRVAPLGVSRHRSYPTVLDRVLRGRRLRWVLALGTICLLGAAASPRQGASWIVLGMVLLGLTVAMLANRWLIRRRDKLSAAALSASLRSGEEPVPVPAAEVDTCGEHLDEDEECFLNRVPAEVSVFYGRPVVIQRAAVIAWGSPLAWALSAVFTFGLWSHGRKKAKKAAPQWREPTPVHMWITSKQLMIKSRRGNTNWHFPLHTIDSCSAEGDGLVFTTSTVPELPLKIRTRGAAWSSVLLHYLRGDGVVDVRLPHSALTRTAATDPAFPT